MKMRIFAFSNINVSSIKTNKMKDLKNLVDRRTFPTAETGRKRVVSQKKEALNGHR